MIPVCTPNLGEEEVANVLECLRSGWISSAGSFVERFEEALAKQVGVAHAVVASGGTPAVHLALAALGIGPGDEVLLPDFTMIASVNPVLYLGATPVLIATDPLTWTMDPADLASKVTQRSRAIMAVPIYGHVPDMDPIIAVARRHGLALVEDAAEGHGGSYKGRAVGSLGDIAAVSFYANKIITTGEGGAVLTDDDGLARRVRHLKNLCLDAERRYFHDELGYNYRMTNLQAAIGLAQVGKMERFLGAKRRMAARYGRGLEGLAGIGLPPCEEWCGHSYWMYGIRIGTDFPMGRDEVKIGLLERGVDSRYFFTPLHRQPCLRGRARAEGDLSFSETLCREGLYLPSGTALTDAEIDHVCEALHGLASAGGVG